MLLKKVRKTEVIVTYLLIYLNSVVQGDEPVLQLGFIIQTMKTFFGKSHTNFSKFPGHHSGKELFAFQGGQESFYFQQFVRLFFSWLWI